MKRKVVAVLSWRSALAALCALALSIAVAAPAFAAGKSDKSATKAVKPVKIDKKTGRTVFTKEEKIIGTVLTGEGEFLGGTPKTPVGSLIEYRFDFNDRMIKGLENI